jgi:hypothetical protein
VQVKSTTSKVDESYDYHLSTGRQKPYTKNEIDFIAAYIVPKDVWYIIPIEVAGKRTSGVILSPHLKTSKQRGIRKRGTCCGESEWLCGAGAPFDFSPARKKRQCAPPTENPVNCCTMGSFPNISQAWQDSFGTASTTSTVASVRLFVSSCPFKPSRPSTRAPRTANAPSNSPASGHDLEWRNRLIWGDKKYVLPSLLPEFAGKVDLVYIDPPMDDSFTFTKEPSLEQKAYRDTCGHGINSYLQWFYEGAHYCANF